MTTGWRALGWLGALCWTACGGAAVPPPTVPGPVGPGDTDVVTLVTARPGEGTSKPPSTPTLPTLVTLSSTPERKVVAADQPTELIVRVRLSAESIPSVKRPPINLALVVDTSGSMQGEPLAAARAACATLVGKLAPGDRVSVVAFGSSAEVLVPSTVLAKDNVAALKQKIAAMQARGTTNMTEGLALGLAEAQKGMQASGINRIVLLGDGVPNDPASTLSYASSAHASGVPITSLGLGVEFDETLMNQVAQRSGGSFHFIDEPQQVAKVFEKEVTRLERVVAQGGWLELTPGPGVAVTRVLGLAGSHVGRAFRVQIGQLSEGQVRDLMVELTVAAHHDGANIELADAVFHYQDAVQDKGGRKLEEFVSLSASKDAGALAEGRNPAVEHEATRIRVADMIVRSIALARGGDVPGARKLLVDAEKVARGGAKRFADPELDTRAAEARELRLTVAKLAPPPTPAWSGGGLGLGAVAPTQMPKPQALGLRKAHGDAMKAINGL